MKPINLSLALFAALLLVACGGSGDKSTLNTSSSSSISSSAKSNSSNSLTSSNNSSSSSNASNPSSNASTSKSSTPVSLYSIGGSVTGLQGSLKLQAGEQSVAILSNGDFTFPNQLPAGSRVSLVVNEKPFRQACAINGSAQFTLRENVNSINITCTPLGVLTGTINDYHTGTPISQAKVTLTALDDDDNILMSTDIQPNEAGAFTLEGIGASSRFVLTTKSDGFVDRSDILSNTVEYPNITRSILVLRANQASNFSASSAASLLVEGNALVELPANAFVTVTGAPATGTITPSVTIIDPSGEASIMPGNYETRDAATGTISHIESFGALDISFRDADGNLLQLAAGTNAIISIPLARGVKAEVAPETVPLFYFDEATGYWIEEGEATLVEENGQHFYRGSVTHFSTWNADRIYESVNVHGCVKDADNIPLPRVRIIASGRNYIGQSTVYSNSIGEFIVPVRKNSTVLLTSISDVQSDTVSVTSTTTDVTVSTCLALTESSATITLTWGEDPVDLDSHLFIPNPETDAEYEVYYNNRTVEVNDVVFDLDVDDVTSFGPEVVTIPDFPHAGTYRYVVKLFSGTSTITASPARVSLNLRGTIYVFSPDDAVGDSSAKHWHVFNIEVDAAGNANVVPVQEFSTVRTPLTEPVARMQRSFKPQSPLATEPNEAAIETKYYAE